MVKQDDAIYEDAAKLVDDYCLCHSIKFESTKEETDKLINDFKQKFAPEVLKSLSDEELLNYIFLSSEGNNDSLCYHLEFSPSLRRAFGSISGGSSYKFGLFQRQEDGEWVTGAPKSPRILSEAEALQIGSSIRDHLVKGCELIGSRTLDSVESYEKLDDDLYSLTDKFSSYAWVRKYFHLMFQDLFTGWYAPDWLKHFLFGFGIIPSQKEYGMNGQLALIKRKTKFMSPDFQDVCYSMFGDIRHFYRLGSPDDGSQHYAEEWRKKGLVAIGWKDIGDLVNYVKNGTLDKDKISQSLLEHYYPNDKKTASRKAGEIKSFYEASLSAVFTVMDGSQLIAFVDRLTPYYYDVNEKMAHRKSGVWNPLFDDTDKLPEDEGLRTTCYEFKNPENLLYLYKKYYKISEDIALPASNTRNSAKSRKIHDLKFGRNRIFFGAPGTGKSYELNKQGNDLFNKENISRVTLYPDYTYSQFVGCYKPVTRYENDKNKTPTQLKSYISYEFVPGPFLETYIKAVQNPKENYLLVVEEINRANPASVFGDIFQLLDRDTGGKSVYEIAVPREMRDYFEIFLPQYATSAYISDPDELLKEQTRLKEESKRLSIPSNMYIWATMNSADQGVFPMDTAFKRRWDFEYIGINNGINEKVQVGGENKILKEVRVSWGADSENGPFTANWNNLRMAINDFLSKGEAKVNEDKLLGPFFVSPENLTDERFGSVFKDKVLLYLFEDACKTKHSKVFASNLTTYSEVCDVFDNSGVSSIFAEGFKNYYKEEEASEVEEDTVHQEE